MLSRTEKKTVVKSIYKKKKLNEPEADSKHKSGAECVISLD